MNNSISPNKFNPKLLILSSIVFQIVLVFVIVIMFFVRYSQYGHEFLSRAESSSFSSGSSTKYNELLSQIQNDYDQKKYQQVKTAAGELLIIASDNSQRKRAYYWQGIAEYNLYDYTNAESSFKMAIALDPNYADPYAGLGVIAHAKFDNQKMMEYGLKCVSLAPRYGWCHNILGISYFDDLQKEKAIAEFRLAVQYDPKSTIFKDNLQRALDR